MDRALTSPHHLFIVPINIDPFGDSIAFGIFFKYQLPADASYFSIREIRDQPGDGICVENLAYVAEDQYLTGCLRRYII